MTARTRYLAVLLATLALVASGCGGSGTSSSSPSSAKPSGVKCDYITDSNSQVAKQVDKPSSTATETGPVKVSIGTNFGDMAAVLDGKAAPCAVNAFLSLAKQGYYDKTTCHRISVDARGFHILQCGDPTGTGAGGPGYRYAEEVKSTDTYPTGTLAMAKTQQPSTTGSQFFVVFGPTQLPPQYTVLGKLTPAGLVVARKASKAALKGKPDPYDGKPATPVNLTTVK